LTNGSPPAKRQNKTDARRRCRKHSRREFVRPEETIEPEFGDSDALAGFTLPDLAFEPTTTLLTVHAAFTAQHIIGELRYHWELGNLTRGDRAMLAQLGKEIAQEFEKEN